MNHSHQSYVLTLLFDPTLRDVALVRKNRPAWQAGKLNGIGGKVGPGEPAIGAAIREFREETGVELDPARLRYFGVMHGPGFKVHCFTQAHADIYRVRSTTDESIEVVPVDLQRIAREGMPNLAALVAGAMDPDAPFLELAYRDHAVMRIQEHLA